VCIESAEVFGLTLREVASVLVAFAVDVLKKHPLLFTFIAFTLSLSSAWAEDLHALDLSYSQYGETLSVQSFEKELSPQALALAYTYISAQGAVLSLDAWHEDDQASLRAGGGLDKSAWGYSVSAAYPLDAFEVELSVAFSKPELDAKAASGNSFLERSESTEYGMSSRFYIMPGKWSFISSLMLGYQALDSHATSKISGLTVSSEIRESGWFLSPALDLSYTFELNERVSISPFVALSWTEFFNGRGATRTSLVRRNVSFTQQIAEDIDSDSSGLVSLGATLSFAQYSLGMSVDETIDLSNVDTQLNFNLGFVW
jgi:Autotransporter beta-domain